MTLQAEDGFLSGTYITGVGAASGTYQLTGFVDPSPTAGGCVLGFTVIWNNASGNSHSVTTWSGQYQTIDGLDLITAMWLMTQETPPSADWEATNVGQDTFVRQVTIGDAVATARQSKALPYPRALG